MIRLWGTMKRHPIVSVSAGTIILGFIGAVPKGIEGIYYIDNSTEPYHFASHSWVRAWADPFIKTQGSHDFVLNYLILKDQRKALEAAKEDLKKHPDSPTVQQVIEKLEHSIDERQKKLDTELKK